MPDAKQTILVVEDDLDLRQMFHLALSLDGFKVLEAGDGYDALALLEGYRVDLVVLDLGLPRIGGLTVQQDIEARAASRRIPVVIVTASQEDLSHVHVDCILRKPVHPADLVEVVRKCLRVIVHDPAR